MPGMATGAYKFFFWRRHGEEDNNGNESLLSAQGLHCGEEYVHVSEIYQSIPFAHAPEASNDDTEKVAHLSDNEDERKPGCSINCPFSFVKKFAQWTIGLAKSFGAPSLMVILAVYGVNQGIGNNLLSLATDYYWKDEQKQKPSSTQSLDAITGIPWDIKPIYGLISDTFPIYGYQRWPYLAICGAAATVCIWCLASIHNPALWVATLLFCGVYTCSAFSDVVTDAMVAQYSRDVPAFASDLQSLSWGSKALGGLIGGGISGLAVDSMGSKGSFLLVSVAPILLLLAALALPEARLAKHLPKTNMGGLLFTVKIFVKTLRTPAIWKPALYIYLFGGALSPNISEAMFYWQTDAKYGPGFGPQFLGLVHSFGYVAMILGVAAYNCWFRQYSFRFMLCWFQVTSSVIGLLEVIFVTKFNHQLGIPDHAFVLGDEVLSQYLCAMDRIISH